MSFLLTLNSIYFSKWRLRKPINGPVDMICINIFKMPYFTFVRWWVVDFKTKFNIYCLMMAIFVKRNMNTQVHCQNWLGGEDKINISSLIIYCNSNWEVLGFKRCCIILVYQLLGFALKSPKEAIKKRLVAEIASKRREEVIQLWTNTFLAVKYVHHPSILVQLNWHHLWRKIEYAPKKY